MFRMQLRIRSFQGPTLWLVMFAIAFSSKAVASTMSLSLVEELAIASDPGIQTIQANQLALEELAVAADQLPDPMLKMGLVSLPTDTFDFGQEAMTQVQFGLVQKFPRGQSRSLRSEQIGLKSKGLKEIARDQELQILLAVREYFLELVKQRHLARINADAISAFTDVADITQDYYATGRVPQQDVLQAAVELAKVKDRATRISQDEEQARSRLAGWIGAVAHGDVLETWPQFTDHPSTTSLINGLSEHPRIVALQRSISAAETGVELARQKYKPEFAVDVTYGGRSGRSADGNSRPDLLSLMVVMDMPFFHQNRQDRMVAAQMAESSAAMYTRDDMLRRMRSEIEFHMATEQKQQERMDLFENTLLPEAAFSSEASFDAYQSSIEDLTTLLRTRITEFDLQLEYARLQAEVLKTRARLLYLEGDKS